MADEKKKPTPAQERVGMNPPPVVVKSIEEARRLRAEVGARIQAALKRRSDTTDTQYERTVGAAKLPLTILCGSTCQDTSNAG
jgi:hypothetical protein